MTISEKVAYLKGLCEGMGINTSGGEGKLLAAIIDTLADIAAEIDNLGENALDLGEEIDAISDDLADVEELLFGDDDDDDDDECCCSDDDDDCCCSDDFYEIKCPSCNGEFTIDSDVYDLGNITCPNCGENLEFDSDEDIYEDSDSNEQLMHRKGAVAKQPEKTETK